MTYEDGTYAVTVYKNGKLNEMAHYDADGKLMGKQFFDKNGILTLAYDYAPTGDVAYESTYTYDEKGVLAKRETVELATGDTLTLTFEFDDKGNEICRTQYDNGVFTATFETEYNAQGQRTKVIETVNDGSMDGKVSSLTIYEYYDDGVKRSEIVYFGETTEKPKLVIYHYPNNMTEREVHYKEDGTIDQAVYFDPEGNPVSAPVSGFPDIGITDNNTID